MTFVRRSAVLLVLTSLACASGPGSPDASPRDFPTRVLITNDDGIDDPGLVALARAFAEETEVWVVAPSTNRSGTGSFLSLNGRRTLSVEPRDLGPGIRAFAVDGYPADCVVLAVQGLMREARPDLVVSGNNRGPNLGPDWMFSGTIGAARVAALAGVPAMAVSGPAEDTLRFADAAARWVVRLARSAALRDLGPNGYLTVAMPRVPPDSARGVVVVDRAPLQMVPILEADGPDTWRVTGQEEIGPPPSNISDEAAWEAGYIVLTPMRADEVDHDRIRQWRRQGVTEEVDPRSSSASVP